MITAEQIQMIRNADPGAVLPGIDTATGNPLAPASLVPLAAITQTSKGTPYYYSPSKNTVYITQAGAALSGIDFGSAMVYIEANNVTIKDCTFGGTTSFAAIDQPPAYSGATVENCTFQGSKSPTEYNIWILARQAITIKDNSFLDSPTDAVDIYGGVVTGNYFSGAAYEPGAHADAIWVTDSTAPTTITDNFIDSTPNADAPGSPNSAIRLTDELGNLSDVTVSGNYLLGGTYAVEVGGPISSPYTISNVSLTDNDIGFDLYGVYYPGTTTSATVTGTTVVDSTNPAASTQALTAYVAAGLPTTNVVSASSTASVVAHGSAPTTILGNGFGAHLFAGAGETNFVGGFGGQTLLGGQGANVLTYLSPGDGGDWVTGFDPGKDVIDLSRMDGDLITPGVQDFTFIGSAAFSGSAAEVRYQLNPAKNVTYVQADLAGDAGATTPDFSITLSGLVPLTAANFALTPAQSSADLASGAALTYTKVKTAAGAPAEYTYANVQGRPYASYQSFYGAGYENLAADNLNLSAAANSLLLYHAGATVTRSGAGESLGIAGMGSDPVAYHSVETIDATTSGGEQFVLGPGFGSETIKGFSASGASPDTIELTASSFSYLTAGMTQAQDLAAVLAHAAGGTSGLTIGDSQGDSLTLTGVSAATLAANPGAIRFA